MEKRSSFTGKIGFIFAAAGSAVGLGNIWRFPYLAAKYGGGIFLFVYLALAVTFGFTLMIAEIVIGRKTGLSAVGAFAKLSKKFSFVGYLVSMVPVIILPYYSVIGGWVMKYFSSYLYLKADTIAKDGYFDSFISGTTEPLFWFLLFITATMLIVILGVEKGVERVSKIMMPVLILLSLCIAAYVIFIPGALKGVVYYIKPDFSRLSVKTVISAMGQLFYSMSLAMGIMITYGSYMKKDVNIETSVRQIELFDTGIAFLSGLMVIPAVFAFSNGDMSALNKGPGLMFVTLPKVFEDIPGGNILGALFFLLVLFAALTSSISLAETVVSVIRDRFKTKRKTACLIVLTGCVLLGLPSALGYGVLEKITPLGMDFLSFFDFISNSVLMPICSLLTCIIVGYVITPKAVLDELELNGRFKSKKLFSVVIKYIAPICLIVILVSSVLEALGIFKI